MPSAKRPQWQEPPVASQHHRPFGKPQWLQPAPGLDAQATGPASSRPSGLPSSSSSGKRWLEPALEQPVQSPRMQSSECRVPGSERRSLGTFWANPALSANQADDAAPSCTASQREVELTIGALLMVSAGQGLVDQKDSRSHESRLRHLETIRPTSLAGRGG